ncbi:MAG TPA: CBS domain-containing protein [Candidatus Aminicenantes bacterium]|nr:CBS domain-containing protein [Candidatus Aminicenantes bacterium]
MQPAVNFYLSQVIGQRVKRPDGTSVGRIQDLIAESNGPRPRVVAVVMKGAAGSTVLDFSSFSIREAHHRPLVTAGEVVPYAHATEEEQLRLVRHVQDKQIVDINGRKLERVNDLRLASLATGTYVVAVDVGFDGFLRRLGLTPLLNVFLRALRKQSPSRLILWDEVEAINFPALGIKLSKSYSKLSTLHSSDLADIIEDLDRRTQAEIFASLDVTKAADVLEELEPDAQANILHSLDLEKAADVLEEMPADEVADILDELEEEKAEQLLDEMEDEASEEVRELMEYPDNTVGSLMTTDFISFKASMRVDQIIAELRRQKPESDTIYYLYVLDDDQRLIANVSLRDLIVADPDQEIERIMSKNVICVHDFDRLDSLSEIISKYNLLALPVVDGDQKMVGMVIIDDIVFHLIKSRKRRV